jgi:N-acylneuraminate cytidylyltransferase
VSYVLALIGARSGSSLKDKNIRMLAGHPLLAYSIRAAQKANNIDRLIVSTDSADYREIALRYGAEVPYLQPERTATVTSTDYDFIEYALRWLEKIDSRVPDLIVHLRPTTPLRNPRVIEQAISEFQSDHSATALRSVQRMPESAYKCFELEGGYLRGFGNVDAEAANQPRQVFPSTYCGNGYVDVLRVSFIQAHRKLHGSLVRAFVTLPVTEVDTEENFDYLEFQAKKSPEVVEALFA